MIPLWHDQGLLIHFFFGLDAIFKVTQGLGGDLAQTIFLQIVAKRTRTARERLDLFAFCLLSQVLDDIRRVNIVSAIFIVIYGRWKVLAYNVDIFQNSPNGIKEKPWALNSNKDQLGLLKLTFLVDINLFDKFSLKVSHSDAAISHLNIICKFFRLKLRLVINFRIEITHKFFILLFPMISLLSVKVKLRVQNSAWILFYVELILS